MNHTVLQRWEGVVEERRGDQLWVRWTDATDPDRDDVYAELSMDSIEGQDDPVRVAAGTRLEWEIHGRQDGTTKALSRIRVLPGERWTQQDLRAIEERADRLLERFRREE